MDQKEQEFLKRLQAAFKIEAKERIQSISTGLLELEKELNKNEIDTIIETIFREAHSLKGASRAVNIADIESICQALEGVFSLIKRGEIELSRELIDEFCNTVDYIEILLSSENDASLGDSDKTSDIIKKLNNIASGEFNKFVAVSNNLHNKKSELQESGFVDGVKPDHSEKECVDSELLQNSSSLNEVDEKEDFINKISNEDFQSEIQHKQCVELTPKAEEPDKITEKEKLKELNKSIKPIQIDKKTTLNQSALSDVVRISTDKLDSVFLQSEEMISLKTTSHYLQNDILNVLTMLERWTKEWNKFNPELKELRKTNNGIVKKDSFNLLEFLDWNSNHIRSVENKLHDISKHAEVHHNTIDSMVDNLIDDMKQVLMLPFSWLLEIFPKMVRDLSRDQGKQIELDILGSEIEIDRRILENMKDPFIHLLRNCVDHGIESPEVREKNGKPRRGTITISIAQKNGNKVEILVTDDGKGIDIEKVKEKALKHGILTEKNLESMKKEELLSLIFQSDISTSPIITDISGRGLGLAILKENIEKLGGSVIVETTQNQGSLFKIVLPLTIATFRGINIQLNEHIFIVPTANVERVIRIKKDDIKTIENKDAIKLNDHTISLVSLEQVLELSQNGSPSKKTSEKENFLYTVLIVNVADKRIAFSVDKVLSEEEVLVKHPGKQLSRIRNIAGVTVLGSGKAAAILNVYDLIKSALKVSGSSLRKSDEGDTDESKHKKSILIAEDSITSRMLIKNILESAGYNVKTTVDGIDAFTALKEGEYDLIVSDVEMPRMNGFGLTSKVRSDKKYSELPVVLVTGLESKEDREHGIDVGANAYIVKSNFDQSNLLNVIDKLI